MSITNYGDLRNALDIWAARGDDRYLSAVPSFITFAEQRILYGSKEPGLTSEPLRIRKMETSVDLTVNTQSVALPTGFLQQRRIYISSTPNITLDFLTPYAFWRNWVSSDSGAPTQFTVEGDNIIFGPSPDKSYIGKILYYQAFDALDPSSDASTNWLLQAFPSVYLYGILIELHKWTRNSDQAQQALAAFSGNVNALNSADKSDRFSTPWTAVSDTGNP